MFRHSVVALAYFDEDGDRLQRRKDLNWSCLWRIDVVVLVWDNRECESDDNLQTDMLLRQSYCFILVLSNNYARIYIYIPVYIYYEYIIYNVLYVYINIYVDTSWLELFLGFLVWHVIVASRLSWGWVENGWRWWVCLLRFTLGLGLFLSCGSDTLILCAGVVCVSHGRLAWLRFPPSLLLGPNSDARALVVLCRFLNRPLVTFFCSSTVLLRCVIFGSPMLISFSNLVSWPADNLLAQWPVSRHDRDECVRVFTLIFMYILTHGWKQPCTSAS